MNLVIGSAGQVGKLLYRKLKAAGRPVIGMDFKGIPSEDLAFGRQKILDIRDEKAVSEAVESARPAVVFLPAALTAVDYCEDHPDEAQAINVQGSRHVAKACRKAGARLVYLSTDYVFDGKAGPYREEDAPNPQSVYARTKLEGEKFALELPAGLVVRTSVVYDWDPGGKNFIMQLIERLLVGQPMRVINDQWNNPTLTRNLADALIELAEKRASGLYNFVGADYMHRFDFALKAVEIFGLNKAMISQITTPELNQKAPRPYRAGLYTDKARRLLKTPVLGVQESLLLVEKDRQGFR